LFTARTRDGIRVTPKYRCYECPQINNSTYFHIYKTRAYNTRVTVYTLLQYYPTVTSDTTAAFFN